MTNELKPRQLSIFEIWELERREKELEQRNWVGGTFFKFPTFVIRTKPERPDDE